MLTYTAAVSVATAILALIALIALVFAIAGHRALSRARSELRNLTSNDALTGLPNRPAIEARLDDLLNRAASAGRQVAVTIVEIERFASVNDLYGREVGDSLLAAITSSLQRALAPGEILARFGGPQFAVITPTAGSDADAARHADELRAAVETAYQVGTDVVQIRATAGYALSTREVVEGQQLTSDAELALHDAIARGPGTTAAFDVSMRARLGRSSPEARLRDAIENEEFWLLYLPVVEVGTNRIVGLEALLRWSDPDRGMVTPSEFLRTLDDSGLIVPLGRWILEEACRQSCTWKAKFPDLDLVTTVNVSPRQLMQADLGDMVREVVEFTGVDPDRICLEITEGLAASTVEEAWSTLRPVREIGVRLALDDFGMGYSSLEFLRQFQLDVLKIDRTLVSAAATSPTDAAIVEQMVNLAHALDLVPVAEGVSNAREASMLEGVRCDFAQGYWFSPPEPVATINRMLERGYVVPGASAPG